MSRFTVWIVQPINDTSPQCLLEVARGVAHSLRQLGHEVAFDPGTGLYIQNPLPFPDGKYGRLIVFGAQNLPAMPLPDDAIIFNAEQVQTHEKWGAIWQASNYIKLLRRHLVWDYADANIKALRTLGVDRVVKCRVGHYPALETVQKAAEEDVDVLFYGSMIDRRLKILNDLAHAKVKTRVLSGVYGEERDRWIGRAKIVLNLHFYEKPIFEIFRVSHLLANSKCVVTEDGGRDLELEEFAKSATSYAPYGELVQTCVELLQKKEMRINCAQVGHDAFREISQVDEVKKAIAVST